MKGTLQTISKIFGVFPVLNIYVARNQGIAEQRRSEPGIDVTHVILELYRMTYKYIVFWKSWCW